MAALWVFYLAELRPVPSEDGVSYLWMAQQFAAGDWHAALSMVFPPGFPLLLAPFVACGVSAEFAADACNAIAFGLTMWPLAHIARRLSPDVHGVDVVTCLLFMSASLLARVASEAYSEPLFLLVMAWGIASGLRGRYWLTGILAGMAFWIRPEGLLLALSFALVRPRIAWRAMVGAAVGVVVLALWRGLSGHGFDPLPITGFHDLRDDLPQRGMVFGNLLELPGAWLEAFGITGAVLVLWLWPKARRALPKAKALWWQVALQAAVVCTFVVRRRFLLSCAVPVVAFAGALLARLPRRWRGLVLMAVVMVGAIGGYRGGIDADRAAEGQVGRYLGGRLTSGERIASDLTRVLWFAGQRPLPPRHFDVDELAAMARPDEVRYFVFSERSKRESSRQIEAALALTFERLRLPAQLASSCAVRGIVVLVRR